MPGYGSVNYNNNKKTTQRNLTNRKVLFGTEVISSNCERVIPEKIDCRGN